MKVDIRQRPDWWLNIIRAYERSLTGDKQYPNNETFQKQLKERYNFYVEPLSFAWAEFESESDYAICLLRWS